MIAIAVVDQNWGIGKAGGMLFSLPKDMAFFKRTTMGHTVVLGRKTLATFPGRKPLPGRHNIVVSRTARLQVPGATVCHSMHGLAAEVNGMPPEEVFLIGGAALYRQLLPACETALITHVEADGAPTHYFPPLLPEEGWHLTATSPQQEQNGLRFRFCRYENQCPMPIEQIPE